MNTSTRDYCIQLFEVLAKPLAKCTEMPIILPRSLLHRDAFVNNDMLNETYLLEKTDTGLRFDITLPFINSGIREGRYEVGYVFRHNPINKGRKRSFIQGDLDLIDTPKNRLKILNFIKNYFDKLGLKIEFRASILEDIRKLVYPEVLLIMDKKDKLSKLQFEAAIQKYYTIEEWRTIENQLKNLEQKWNFPSFVIPDAYIIRGHNFYTDLVFEVKIPSLSSSLTFAGGGCYKGSVKFVGASIGITRLAEFIELPLDTAIFFQDESSFNQMCYNYNPLITLIVNNPSRTKHQLAKLINYNKIIYVDEESIKDKLFKVKGYVTPTITLEEYLSSTTNL